MDFVDVVGENVSQSQRLFGVHVVAYEDMQSVLLERRRKQVSN